MGTGIYGLGCKILIALSTSPSFSRQKYVSMNIMLRTISKDAIRAHLYEFSDTVNSTNGFRDVGL